MRRRLQLSPIGLVVVAAIAITVTIAGVAPRRGSNPAAASAPEIEDKPMIYLKGGAFLMGTAKGDDDERPAHRITLSPFYIDATEVTNAQFARFVAATGYKTDAEREGSAWVFKQGFKDWESVKAADWRHPLGPESSIVDKMNHPVISVSWNDAAAYAKWAGKRMPTEAEWEYAARGGREGEIYAWGNQLKPEGKVLANFWQGAWPNDNLMEDKFYYTAPVGSFAPNGYGLYDMIGNAWEWTADWYAPDYYKHSPAKNPKGPASGEMRVARGGSWFCSENYCGAYRVSFRGQSPPDSGFNNVGFRCARDARGE